MSPLASPSCCQINDARGPTLRRCGGHAVQRNRLSRRLPCPVRLSAQFPGTPHLLPDSSSFGLNLLISLPNCARHSMLLNVEESAVLPTLDQCFAAFALGRSISVHVRFAIRSLSFLSFGRVDVPKPPLSRAHVIHSSRRSIPVGMALNTCQVDPFESCTPYPLCLCERALQALAIRRSEPLSRLSTTAPVACWSLPNIALLLLMSSPTRDTHLWGERATVTSRPSTICN